MSSAVAVLFGSLTTAIAIFGGGLAVEAYRHRRARIGMALALAGAIDALLRLIETRDIPVKIEQMIADLEAGRPLRIGLLNGPNRPFMTITDAYAGEIGSLGGDLPFRVARFLTHTYGANLDVLRLASNEDDTETKIQLIRELGPLWDQTRSLGIGLVEDLQVSSGRSAARRRRGVSRQS